MNRKDSQLCPGLLLIILLCSWLATASQSFAKGLTSQEMVRIRSVREAVISPDGSEVAYTLSAPRNPFEEEDGDPWKELYVVDREGNTGPFVEKVRLMPNVIDVKVHDHVLQVTIDDPADYSRSLSGIFEVLHGEGLELISFSSGSQTLEEAFLNLLEEEETHGFLRAIAKRA